MRTPLARYRARAEAVLDQRERAEIAAWRRRQAWEAANPSYAKLPPKIKATISGSPEWQAKRRKDLARQRAENGFLHTSFRYAARLFGWW